jgi:cytochrome P450
MGEEAVSDSQAGAPSLGPFAPAFSGNPYPFYAVMRHGRREMNLGPFRVWLLTRYEEVLSGFKRPEIFSSLAFRESRPELLQARGATPEQVASFEAVMLASVPTVLNTDPPEHGRYRGILNRGFTPRGIGRIEGRIREITTALVDELIRKGGPADLVRELTIPLPVTVIAELLGVDPARREEFKRWSDAAVNQNARGAELDRTIQAMGEFNAYFASEIERRRAVPSDDLISVLVQAETDEGRLSPQELVAFCRLLLIAGNETTTNLIGNAMIALLANPDQLERLRAEPHLIENAVEETLRFDPPVQGLPRAVLRDVEVGDEKIPAGARVLLMIGSANRDPDRWPDADRFDVGRDTTGHLGFGFGIHYCLGSHLARLESRIALEAILGRLRNLRLAGDVERIVNPILRGPARLPLAFEPA